MKNIRSICASALLAIIANCIVSPAMATVVYSLSNVPMADTGGSGDMLYVSGTFSVDFLNFGGIPFPAVPSDFSSPLSVDFTVTNNSSFTRSFTNASYFSYVDGIGANGSFYMDLMPTVDGPLDANFDQLYLTIINNDEVSASFSANDFLHGFTSPNPVPDVSEATVPEPGALVLMSSGLFLFALVKLARNRATTLPASKRQSAD